MIGQPHGKDLGFVLQTPESSRVNTTVAVALEFVTVRVRKLGIATSSRALQRKAQVSENVRLHLVRLREAADEVDRGAAYRRAGVAQRLSQFPRFRGFVFCK